MLLIQGRDYFFCQYCGSFHFPQQTSEGVRILDPLQHLVGCPICDEPLHRASINQYPALHCKKCKGTLMQQILFGEVVQYLRGRARGPADRPRLLEAREIERRIRCPNCSQMMQTHPYAGPGNIVIDTCASCYVIWLDYGEINQIVNAPGRDRGQPWYVEHIEEHSE
jgi:Zn-finger nucleic acid-binding protein